MIPNTGHILFSTNNTSYNETYRLVSTPVYPKGPIMTESHKPVLRVEDDMLFLDAKASVPEAFDAGVAHGMGMTRAAMTKQYNTVVAQRNASLTLAVGTLVVSNWSSIKAMSSSLKNKYDERREAKRKETK